ncbi:putative zinc finger/helix-turn-helix protein, YgiT family [Kingella denitrificans]|uniref:DNA-binding helix-turn-helix protein n=1 Tax=Kingella denitrificans ATCC 33394 TaxID=888741 RepID=F0EYD3_9NEIS|nr:DNA-binding transcriptional regulator [Kingella denitrificans]EGC17541.1 DNA-binding helix-turn-helix protein [Kingella denitrificans ATCC 33394]QQB41537.1 DNA-binding transcriptional regulator [Kingella denitrificans]STR12620.1 putative zinc finger/helix-turn-helix protein, YgiT family [Kingella denitrificans]
MKYESDLLATAHDIASSLHRVGAIDDRQMRKYDKACLTKVEPLSGEQIRAIREKEDLTQAAFAIHLNISKNQVSDWERGVKKPSGTALKLLTIVKNKGIGAIAG